MSEFSGDRSINLCSFDAANSGGAFPVSESTNSLSEYPSPNLQQLPTELLEAFRLQSQVLNPSDEALLSFGSASLPEQNQADAKSVILGSTSEMVLSAIALKMC